MTVPAESHCTASEAAIVAAGVLGSLCATSVTRQIVALTIAGQLRPGVSGSCRGL